MGATGAEQWAQLLESLVVPLLTALAGWLGGKLRGAAKERREREAKEVAERAEKERREQDDRDLYREALRELFLYRLQDIHEEYVVDGRPCPISEKHRAETTYHLYHDRLGGNGTGTQLYTEIMAAHVE